MRESSDLVAAHRRNSRGGVATFSARAPGAWALYAAAAGIAVAGRSCVGILIGMRLRARRANWPREPRPATREAVWPPADLTMWPTDSVSFKIPAEYSPQGTLVAVDPESKRGQRALLDRRRRVERRHVPHRADRARGPVRTREDTMASRRRSSTLAHARLGALSACRRAQTSSGARLPPCAHGRRQPAPLQQCAAGHRRAVFGARHQPDRDHAAGWQSRRSAEHDPAMARQRWPHAFGILAVLDRRAAAARDQHHRHGHRRSGDARALYAAAGERSRRPCPSCRAACRRPRTRSHRGSAAAAPAFR